MVRCPAPLALVTNAFPMASVVSARRTVSSVGSRIWVRPQSPHPALRGVLATRRAPTPRTVRVRRWPRRLPRPVQRARCPVSLQRAVVQLLSQTSRSEAASVRTDSQDLAAHPRRASVQTRARTPSGSSTGLSPDSRAEAREVYERLAGKGMPARRAHENGCKSTGLIANRQNVDYRPSHLG